MADRLVVRGAREHNLRDVSLDLPRDRLIVFTGLSGSGKSSLAFDTIYAEGQRRYVESLSAYARQFLGQMDKPDVDFIEGLSPAISIDQKSASRNPRSDRGDDHRGLRLPASPVCPHRPPPLPRLRPARGAPDPAADRRPGPRAARGDPLPGLAPVVRGRKGEYSTLLDDLAKQGFARVRVDGVPARALRPGRGQPGPLRDAHHRGGGRPPGQPGQRAPAPDRVDRDGPGADGRHGRGARHERDGGGGGGRGHHLLPAPGLHPLRHQLRGAGAAQLLLQLALRGLPGLPRPRHQVRGRPRAGRARRLALAGRGCAGAVGRRAQRVLHRAAGGGGRARRLLLRRPVEVAQGQGQEARPLRDGQPRRCTSPTRTASTGSARTRRSSRASSPGCSAATASRSRTGRASRSSSTCARWPVPSATGARLKPESLAVTVGGRNIYELCSLSIAGAVEAMAVLELATAST